MAEKLAFPVAPDLQSPQHAFDEDVVERILFVEVLQVLVCGVEALLEQFVLLQGFDEEVFELLMQGYFFGQLVDIGRVNLD